MGRLYPELRVDVEDAASTVARFVIGEWQ